MTIVTIVTIMPVMSIVSAVVAIVTVVTIVAVVTIMTTNLQSTVLRFHRCQVVNASDVCAGNRKEKESQNGCFDSRIFHLGSVVREKQRIL
ncbi:hypothetical protein FisN_29Lu006 [Fistulifera solaris]|uniref:Uncharacterized protein n=1 Tax=Fistulifera solaris TaxID=1519565 RepID=A0A1Z5JLL7_FISSO|nr:hypothetical protein FisN_29Lu006 [Fistulifera solaris]|eukprot:GAX14806.1 hypothetical protein FisN_29Lu006 [Fistulifera solaris]